MTPTIYDVHGAKRDMAWLRSKYGNLVVLDAGEGRKYALTRVDETEGMALIRVRVLGPSGNPQQGVPVANHWPDASLPDQTGTGAQTLWQQRALALSTDANGLVGFGLGDGSYIANLEEGGPHSIWVLSTSLPSDGLSGIGMLGGTNHLGPLMLTFQVLDEDATPTPPAAPAADQQDVMQRLDEVMMKLEVLQTDLRQLLRHFGAG